MSDEDSEGKSFGLGCGDGPQGGALRQILPGNIAESALPQLVGRSHDSNDVAVSLALPYAVTLRDAYLMKRVREVCDAYRQHARQEAEKDSHSSTPSNGAASMQDDDAKEDSAASSVVGPDSDEPDSKRSRVESGAASSSVSSPAVFPLWPIVDLKTALKIGIIAGLRASGYAPKTMASLEASIAAIASDADDSAVALCLPAFIRHAGMDSRLETVSRVGKRFKGMDDMQKDSESSQTESAQASGTPVAGAEGLTR